MTEFDTTPQDPSQVPGDDRQAGDQPEAAWKEVMRALDDLGSSVAAWAKAVKDDPETRRRASQMQERLEGYGRQISETFDAAARSDFARQVSSAAVAAGDVAVDTARRVGDEAATKMAGAVRAVSDSIRKAAEERTTAPGETESTASVEIHVTQETAVPGDEPFVPGPSSDTDDYES